MVEEVILVFVLVHRGIDLQRVAVQGIGLAHIGDDVLAVEGDACLQPFDVLVGRGGDGYIRCVEMGGDGVIHHIQVAELEGAIQEHLLNAAFEVVGAEFDVGVLHVGVEGLAHLGLHLAGAEGDIGAFFASFLGGGRQGDVGIQYGRSHMDGVHVEGKAFDLQVSLSEKPVKVVVFQRLHQLVEGAVGIEVEVGATSQLDVFREEGFQIGHRHVARHVELEAQVAQQVLDGAFGVEARLVELGVEAVDDEVALFLVEVQGQQSVEVDFRERIRQRGHIDGGIVGGHLGCDHRHEAVVDGAHHLCLGDAQLATVFYAAQRLLQVLRQVGQHVLDDQGAGIQGQVEVDVAVVGKGCVAIHIDKVLVQTDLCLFEVAFLFFEAELQGQIEAQRVVLQIVFLEVEADVGRGQIQGAGNLVHLGDVALEVEVQVVDGKTDGVLLEVQRLGTHVKVCLDVLFLEIAVQVEIEAQGAGFHPVARIGIERIGIFQLNLFYINEIIKRGRNGVFFF